MSRVLSRWRKTGRGRLHTGKTELCKRKRSLPNLALNLLRKHKLSLTDVHPIKGELQFRIFGKGCFLLRLLVDRGLPSPRALIAPAKTMMNYSRADQAMKKTANAAEVRLRLWSLTRSRLLPGFAAINLVSTSKSVQPLGMMEIYQALDSAGGKRISC